MNATSVCPSVQSTAGVIVGVDLAKNVFQLCVADAAWRPRESQRLTRAQFERWFANRAVSRVIMEACGSAHHWARWLTGLGIEVTPAARALRARLRQAQQDRCRRCSRIARSRALRRPAPGAHQERRAAGPAGAAPHPQPVAGRPHAAHQHPARLLPRVRYRHRAGRAPGPGADRARAGRAALGHPRVAAPDDGLLVEEVRLLEARIGALERELAALVRHSPACTTLLSVPGIGLLTSTAMVAATSGDVTHFKDARHFASWFGLTPKEHSSGQHRQLGRISKQGDRYLRMLLTHGARSVLRAAAAARNAGKPVNGLRAWALAVQDRSNHNKAGCALANKLARIAYACLRDHAAYGENNQAGQEDRTPGFAMPAGALAEMTTTAHHHRRFTPHPGLRRD